MAAHRAPMLETVSDGKVTTAAAALGLIEVKPEEEEKPDEELQYQDSFCCCSKTS